MDRVALTAYLEREFAEIITEASIVLDRILDSVEAVYGWTPDLLSLWEEPLADYYLLRRAKRAFMVMFDVGVEGDTYRLNQLYKNVTDALPKAEAIVAWLVSPVTPDTSNTGRIVTLEIPYLEPTVTGGDTAW